MNTGVPDPNACTGSSSLHTVNQEAMKPVACSLREEHMLSRCLGTLAKCHGTMAFSWWCGNLEKVLHGQSAFTTSHFVVLFVRIQLRSRRDSPVAPAFYALATQESNSVKQYPPGTYGTCGKSCDPG